MSHNKKDFTTKVKKVKKSSDKQLGKDIITYNLLNEKDIEYYDVRRTRIKKIILRVL